MSEAVIVGIIAFLGNFLVSLISNNKTTALITYRLEQLEKKVEKHNSVVERTYKAERDISTAFVRIDELKENIKEVKEAIDK